MRFDARRREIARIGGSDCKEFIINMMVSEGGMDKALVVMVSFLTYRVSAS